MFVFMVGLVIGASTAIVLSLVMMSGTDNSQSKKLSSSTQSVSSVGNSTIGNAPALSSAELNNRLFKNRQKSDDAWMKLNAELGNMPQDVQNKIVGAPALYLGADEVRNTYFDRLYTILLKTKEIDTVKQSLAGIANNQQKKLV